MASNPTPIRFLRGKLANLPQTYNNGTIYITTDEPGMYMDVDASTRIHISDFVHFQTAEEFALFQAQVKAGQKKALTSVFYYIVDENVLAKYAPGVAEKDWYRVNNPIEGSGGSSGISSVSSNVYQDDDDTIVVETIISTTEGGRKIASFNITTEDTDALAIEPTDLGDGFTVRARKVDTKGTLEAVSVSGGVQLNLTNTTTGTDASGETVNETVAGGSITIKPDASDGSSVYLQDNNTIVIKATPTEITQAFDEEDSGELTTTLVLPNGGRKIASITPKLVYGKDNTTTAVFNSEEKAILNVYTADQVDNLLTQRFQAVNAMTFKGGVNNLKPLPTVASEPKPQIGDTYIVEVVGTYDNRQNCRIGDLFIATGTEVNGEIVSDLVWTYVPAGDDEQIVVLSKYDEDDITEIYYSYAGSNHTVARFAAKDGIKSEHDDDTTTFSHDTPGTALSDEQKTSTNRKTTSTSSTGVTSVQAIDQIEFDKFGHIVNYNVKTYSIDDINTVDLSVDTSESGTGATFTHTIGKTSGSNKISNFTIDTDEDSMLQIKVVDEDSAKIEINAVWGTFGE